MHWRHLMIVGALLPLVSAHAADGVATGQRVQAQLEEVLQLARAKDPKGCAKKAQALIGTSDFRRQSDPFRGYTYFIAAVCSLDANDRAASREFAVQATMVAGATPEMWRLRSGLEMQNEAQPTAALVGLEAMATRAPEALNALPLQWIYLFYNRVKKGSDLALRRRALELFAAKTYAPTEVDGSADYFRSELAKLRATDGDIAGASTLIASIMQPSTLLDLSLDPRTRSLIPKNFDVRAVTERELTRRRDIAASHPNSLGAVIEVANALRWLGRYEEALAGLASASPEGAAGASFTDRDEKLNWWWDAVGYANVYLGRYDAALTAFRQGIDSKERGDANVSQSINLANQQLIFGRNADAIKTLDPLGEGKGTSPYGMMQLIGVRGCARFRTDDTAGADADYAYAKVHEKDAPHTLTDLALCRNDLDVAAASLVRRLDDDDRRVDALLVVSDFNPLPAAYPKQVEDERLALVKARPEVKAAIARAGGARRFNLMTAPF
jgi:tetratricopeptide (TPR) repeat protein